MSEEEISVDAALIHLEAGTATFMDVRDGGSFRSGRVPGALHVGDHNIGEFVETADKGRPVIVYCYHGNSSLGGAAYLRAQGFEQVWSMEGGFAVWHGRPTEDSPPLPTPPLRPPTGSPVEPQPRVRRRDRWLRRLRSLSGRG